MPKSVCCVIVFLCVSCFSETAVQHDDQIRVSLRKIGHEILLNSNDSTSLILPIEKISQNVYVIKFEKPFSFEPDKLVNIVHRTLAADQFPLHYLVQVMANDPNEIIYSYRIEDNLEKSVIPCLTRKPPVYNYAIQIKFLDAPFVALSRNGLIQIFSFPTFCIFLFIAWKRFNKKNTIKEESLTSDESGDIVIGKLDFCMVRHILKINSVCVDLSAKESKLLKVFLSYPNEIIDRDKLLNDVWGEEGVIVGRSLDVFVSKLRKKLLPETSVRIVTIHGRGYKLEIVKN